MFCGLFLGPAAEGAGFGQVVSHDLIGGHRAAHPEATGEAHARSVLNSFGVL
jgi:hypothetical protein